MKNNLPLNPIQTLVAIAKIAILLLLPVISFGYMGFILPVGFNGLRLVQAGNGLMYIPLGLYALMLIFSFGQLQKMSLVAGGIGLICEIVFMNMTGTLLQQGDMGSLITMVMNAIPANTVLGVEITKDFIINTFAKPGLAWTINLIGTVLYIGSYFLINFIGGNSGAGCHQGTGPNLNNQRSNGTRTSSNRNNPVL